MLFMDWEDQFPNELSLTDISALGSYKGLFPESRSSIPESRSWQQSRISLPSYPKFPDPAFQYPENPIGDPLQTQKILNEFRVNPYIVIV